MNMKDYLRKAFKFIIRGIFTPSFSLNTLWGYGLGRLDTVEDVCNFDGHDDFGN